MENNISPYHEWDEKTKELLRNPDVCDLLGKCLLCENDNMKGSRFCKKHRVLWRKYRFWVFRNEERKKAGRTYKQDLTFGQYMEKHYKGSSAQRYRKKQKYLFDKKMIGQMKFIPEDSPEVLE